MRLWKTLENPRLLQATVSIFALMVSMASYANECKVLKVTGSVGWIPILMKDNKGVSANYSAY